MLSESKGKSNLRQCELYFLFVFAGFKDCCRFLKSCFCQPSRDEGYRWWWVGWFVWSVGWLVCLACWSHPWIQNGLLSIHATVGNILEADSDHVQAELSYMPFMSCSHVLLTECLTLVWYGDRITYFNAFLTKRRGGIDCFFCNKHSWPLLMW